MKRILIRIIILLQEGNSVKSYSSRELIKIIQENGWYHVETIGDHQQFKHPAKKGKVTVTHPVKDVPIGTVKRILKQAGITLR